MASALEYDFDAFAPAKKREEKQNTKPELRKVSEAVKTEGQLKEERSLAFSKIVRWITVSVVFCTFAALNIYGYSQIHYQNLEYAKLNEKYEMMQSENTWLSMELNNMISIEQIDKIAVEQLGLVKLNASDIEYVKISEGNKVIVSSGRIVE